MKQKTEEIKKSKFQILSSALYVFLLYYSALFSTILIIGGFCTARSGKEIVSNILFLPVTVFLWMALIKYRKENKAAKKK